MDMRIRGSTRGDGVEVIRESRGFNQSLTSTGGAAVVVGVLRALAIKRNRNQLRFDDRLMHGAIGEIGDLLRVAEPEHPPTARVISAMPGVIGSRSVAFAQGSRHRRITDAAGPSAVPHYLKFSIPVFGRQKHGG